MAPLLSVVMPVLNGARFIGPAIESVLRQDLRDWELVVVDGGSTDGTLAVVARFTDPRILCIHQCSKGLPAARNEGIRATSGDWLGFLDADDLWLGAFGLRMLEAAAAAPGAGVICCGWQYVDVEDKPQGPARIPSPDSLSIGHLLRHNAFPAMAAIVHRPSLEAVGLFDAALPALADWDLWLRLAASGFHFSHVDEILAAYRQTPGSMSHNAPLMLADSFAVLDKFFARPDLAPEVRALRQTAYGLCRLASEAQFFDAGPEDDRLRRLAQVLSEYPALLQEMDTYYAILCAGQETAFLGTGEALDLRGGADRLRRVLDKVQAQSQPMPASTVRQARKLGYLALAELALQQDNRRLALTYAARSGMAPGDRWARRRSARLLLKALAGRRLHEIVARRVRRAGVRPVDRVPRNIHTGV